MLRKGVTRLSMFKVRMINDIYNEMLIIAYE
jgi:hypothetical protein